MGRHDVEIGMPDTYGLPEHLISNVVTEIDGPNVRMICGIKRAGRIDWLYSCVMRADHLVQASRDCNDAAIEALSLLNVATGPGH